MGDLTSDGHIMAYKAGAEITGKEFEDFHNGMTRREGGIWLSSILPMTNEELSPLKDFVLMPAKRRGGFSPNWVTQILKNVMMPYHILRIKHGERLQATLTLVEFMGDHLSPKLFARDPHELRLAHETKNMIINAEMKMRASLFRTESRGTHYREDYPQRVDPDWLAWVMIKEVDGKMAVSKKSIPKEWWPDLTIPYEQRYPAAAAGS